MVPLLLVHPTVTTTALAPFTCREIGDHRYLEADFAWRCDATAVVVARWLLGLPMLLAYTVGIPLTYYLLLRRQQEHLHTRLRATCGFLIAGFRRDRWFWELWNTLRKALFTASAVLLGPVGVKMQTWAALGLLFLFFVIFSNGHPYDRPVLNQLEMTALGVDVWQLLCGLGLFLSPDAATSELFTWMIVLVNVGFVTQFLSCLWLHGEAMRCGRKRTPPPRIRPPQLQMRVTHLVNKHRVMEQASAYGTSVVKRTATRQARQRDAQLRLQARLRSRTSKVVPARVRK